MVGLMWSLPFLQLHHRYSLTSFYSEWLAFALRLVALAALAQKQAWRNMQLPLVALFPLGLIALLILQCALDRVPYAGQALTAALYLVWAVLLMLVGNLLRRALGMAAVSSVLAWLVLAAGAVTALSVMQGYRSFERLRTEYAASERHSDSGAARSGARTVCGACGILRYRH